MNMLFDVIRHEMDKRIPGQDTMNLQVSVRDS